MQAIEGRSRGLSVSYCFTMARFPTSSSLKGNRGKILLPEKVNDEVSTIGNERLRANKRLPLSSFSTILVLHFVCVCVCVFVFVLSRPLHCASAISRRLIIVECAADGQVRLLAPPRCFFFWR